MSKTYWIYSCNYEITADKITVLCVNFEAFFFRKIELKQEGKIDMNKELFFRIFYLKLYLKEIELRLKEETRYDKLRKNCILFYFL